MKSTYNIFLYMSTILLIVISSCKKDAPFLQTQPHDSMTDITFWKSEKDAVSALTKCYSNAFSLAPWLDECASDNSFQMYDWYSGTKLIADGSVNQFSAIVNETWKTNYATIRSCNFVIENLDKVPFKTQGLKERLLAEARFIRAWQYLNLTFNFGDVPLVTKMLTVDESKDVMAEPQLNIYKFIIEELDFCASVLPSTYTSSETARATKGASYALKARTYLFQNDFVNVLKSIKQVEDLSLYTLNTSGETPYNDLFSGVNSRNAEVIFSINKTEKQGILNIGHGANQALLIKGLGGDDPYVTTFASGSIVDSYPMLDGRLIHEVGSSYDAKNPYQDRDPRLSQSIIYPGSKIATFDGENVNWDITFDPEDGQSPLAATAAYNYIYGPVTGLLWKKYCDFSPWGMTNSEDGKTDILLIRYADILLMKAEALVETSGAKEEVINIINKLRDRCKGGKVKNQNYNGTEELKALVRNERRVELANEGLRYFDLIRWKIAEKNPTVDREGLNGDFFGAHMRLDGIGKNDKTISIDNVPRRYIETRFFDKSKRYLLPIPQREIDLNTNLKQNKGYN